MALEAFSLIGRIALDGADKVTSGLGDIGKRTKAAGRTMESFGQETFRAMDTVADSTDEVQQAVKAMREEMREAVRQQKRDMGSFRLEQLKTQKAWWDLTKASKNWKGSTSDLMREVTKLGQAQKKANEAMMAHNDIAKMGLLQSIGTMQAMSTQSEKITKNYDRMGKALYGVNKPLLAITDGLENMAKAGQPAALALKMLGANANMKDLQSMIGLITRGLVRFQAVAIASGLALAGMTAALANAAHGEAPDKIREQMAEIENIYDEALEERRADLYEWAGLFEDIDFKPPKKEKLMAALAEQVKIFENWAKNIKDLAKRGVDEGLIRELEEMTPKAAAEVQALSTMTDKELTKYVELWRQKHQQAREKATTELEWLREATDEKIQELKDSMQPLALAWEDFKGSWANALQPFIDSWGQVAAKVVDAGTAVADFFETLNNNDMQWVIQVLGWVVFLFTALTFLLSPLAIGVGLVAGFQAAWASLAPFIMPLVTGLGAMAGTIVLIIAAVAAVVAIIYMLVQGFKDWVNSSEETRAAFEEKVQAMRDKVEPIIEDIKSLFTDGMQMVKDAIKPILDEITAFWDEHGMQVMEAVSNFMGFLGAIFNVVFPIIKFIVMGALNAILGIFSGVFNAIMGIIKIFTGLFTGDFGLMWEGAKQLFFGAIEAIWNYMNLLFIGRILKGVGAFFTFIKGMFTRNWTLLLLKIRTFGQNSLLAIRNFVNGIKTWFTNMKNSAIGIWNGLQLQVAVAVKLLQLKVRSTIQNLSLWVWKTFDTMKTKVATIWNNIKTAMTKPMDSAKKAIGSAIQWIKDKFAGLKLKLPNIKTPKFKIRNWSLNPKNWIKNPPYIDIDWNKRGAFFDQATALQGLGEKGTEAIIPIQNRRYMQPFSQAIAENLAALTGGGAQRVEVPIYLNNREILRAIIPDLDRELKVRQHRQSGLVNRGNL
jgi:phage-related protein